MNAAGPTHVLTLQQAFPWLAALPPAARDRLVGELPRHVLPKGSTLFDVGRPCEGFPLVVDGQVRVVRSGPQGRELLLYRVGPGESCILTSSCLLGAADYTARAVAETEVTLYLLPRERFFTLLGEHPPFRDAVFHLFADRLTELMTLVDAVAFQRLDQRLAARLLGHGAVIATSHQALAQELGSVREIVTRVLGELETRGLVALARGRIEITDAAGLRRVAEHGL